MKVKTFAAILVMCGFLYNPVGLHAQQTLTANSPAAVNINNGQRVQLRFTAPSAGTYIFTHLDVGLTWRPEGSSARFSIYTVQNFCAF